MKKSSKIIITLLILVLIVALAFGGYFILELSDKVAEQDNKIATLENSDENSISIENDIENEVATSDDNIISNDEAYELGKDMYNKIVNFSYEEGESNAEDGMSEILNISELKKITTEDVFKTYLTEAEIAVEKADDGSYWNVGARGTDISYLDYWTIEVKNISENKINYEVTEFYVKNSEDYGKDISELNNDELIMETNKFALVKENSIWKVSEFTYPK